MMSPILTSFGIVVFVHAHHRNTFKVILFPIIKKKMGTINIFSLKVCPLPQTQLHTNIYCVNILIIIRCLQKKDFAVSRRPKSQIMGFARTYIVIMIDT